VTDLLKSEASSKKVSRVLETLKYGRVYQLNGHGERKNFFLQNQGMSHADRCVAFSHSNGLVRYVALS
jgi:hypothetical protein